MASQLSSSEKRRKYRSLLKRDGNQCFWCDITFSDEWPYTLDHLIPGSCGGSNNLLNLVLCCDFCNVRRGNMAAGEFMKLCRDHPVPVEKRSKAHLHEQQQAERKNRTDYSHLVGE